VLRHIYFVLIILLTHVLFLIVRLLFNLFLLYALLTFFTCVNIFIVTCLLWLLFDCISLADYLLQELS